MPHEDSVAKLYNFCAYEKEVHLAYELARRAGDVVLEHYNKPITVVYKNVAQDDPVTPADKAANQLIVEGIQKAFPEDAILAEESQLLMSKEQRQQKRRLWCVDPIDGTREFIAKNGHFVVMIGLAIDKKAVLGAVYQPTTDTMYLGAAGKAYVLCQGKIRALTVSRINRFSEATAMMSRSHPSKALQGLYQQLKICHYKTVGSVGLKVAMIADAQAELYMSTSSQTSEWDVCAPEAILKAAGGQLTDVHGQPLLYNKDQINTPHGILAGNEALHRMLVQSFKNHTVGV